jgi:formamidopyrimidine-DNA glycosylase
LHDLAKLTLAGWVHIRGEKTAYTNYYKKMKDADVAQWPPKFWKFEITTEGDPEVQIAFTDARRFGRVRLVDCTGADIRQHSPLVENGPDPVVDTDRFTKEYLGEKMRSRHVPIKALLLDQAMISGIGNWVADETLYQAKMHPEQYCDDFGDSEVATLYESIRYVCQTAVDKLGDSDEFPEHWLFNYRWGKGGKEAATKLPNGEKLAFITVGGRTSCYAPGVQKKSGRVVPGVKVEPATGDGKVEAPTKGRKTPRPKEEPKDESEAPPPKKLNRDKTDKVKIESPAIDPGRRRSSRLQK